MRTLLFTAYLLMAAPVLQAAGEPAPANAHPLTGSWSWSIFGSNCTETWQYRGNRTVLSTSGQEVAEKTYEVAKLPDASGFYKLVETVVRQNDKKDCSGALLNGPGEQITRFIQFNPQRNRMLVCEKASLKACFGPVSKME